MATAPAITPEEYIATLEVGRAQTVRQVRDAINQNLPEGYQEAVNYGMICWQVPLSAYPDTYNKQPLMLAGLVNRKSYVSLHFLPVYIFTDQLKKLLAAAPDIKMGKGCINFTTTDQLPLATILEIMAAYPADKYIEAFKAARSK